MEEEKKEIKQRSKEIEESIEIDLIWEEIKGFLKENWKVTVLTGWWTFKIWESEKGKQKIGLGYSLDEKTAEDAKSYLTIVLSSKEEKSFFERLLK